MKRDLGIILSYTTKKGECLEWTRCFNTDGYPRAVIDGNANGKVHRVVWEIHNNSSAKGFVIRHSCDNPRCINPAHLSIGSNTDNMKDRDLRERHGASKLTHDQVREIRKLWDTGQYYGWELSSVYKINTRTLYSLIKGNHWKSVN